jgi:hypothetical protein
MLNFTQSFRCPNCNEYINTDAVECRFCHQPVDAQGAIAAAAMQENINRACNDASNLRNVAGAMWVMTLVRFIPFVGCFAGVAALILFVASAAMLIRWEVKYAWIRTVDPDFAVAKRNRLIGMLLTIGALVFFIVVFVVSVVYTANSQGAFDRY